MTYSFQSTSNLRNVVHGLRKGGLQIFSLFTINGLRVKVSERTHPYVVNHFNWFDDEQQILGRG